MAWTSLASMILIVLKHYGVLKQFGITVNEYNAIVDSLMMTLVAFGIFNNNSKGTKNENRNY